MSQNVAGKRFGVVVDIGAGREPYRKFMTCDTYIALDVENRAGSADVVLADINKSIPLGDASADCVVCTEVLEHLTSPDIAVREMARILKPGGLLLLTTPMVWPLHEAPNDYYRYTRFGLEYLLKNAGFGVISIEPSSPYLYTVSQLLLIHLRRKCWYPLVVAVNIFAMIGSRFSKRDDLPLGNFVVAYK